MDSIAINIIIGVVAGIISGIYTGLVMTKYTAFSQIRLSIIRIARNISFGGSNGVLDLATFPNYLEIGSDAGTLLYLGHKTAGGAALDLFKEIASVRGKALMYFQYKAEGRNIPKGSTPDLRLNEAFAYHEKWQDQAMQLRPSLLTILMPTFRL